MILKKLLIFTRCDVFNVLVTPIRLRVDYLKVLQLRIFATLYIMFELPKNKKCTILTKIVYKLVIYRHIIARL